MTIKNVMAYSLNNWMSCKQIMSTKLFRNQIIISPWHWSSDHTWFESCGDFKNINPDSFRVIQKNVINDGSFHGSPVIKIRYEFIFIISKSFWTKKFCFYLPVIFQYIFINGSYFSFHHNIFEPGLIKIWFDSF